MKTETKTLPALRFGAGLYVFLGEIMFWKISPHHTKDFDSCVMPRGTDALDHAALEYAQERMLMAWDSAVEGVPQTVTIELCAGECPIPDDDDNDV